MRLVSLVSLLWPWLIGTSVGQQQCVDRTHFFYNCDQLKQYCNVPQAVAIREKCPVTCNTCSERNQVGPTAETSGYTDPPASTQPYSNVAAKSPSDLRDLTDAKEEEVRRRRLRERDRLQNVATPLTDDQAAQHILKCCIENGLKSECHSLCSYEITKEQVISKALANICSMDDAKIWTKCASSGHDNTACCASSQPPVENCEEFCRGEMPTVFSRSLYCLNTHLHNILNCAKQSLLTSDTDPPRRSRS